MLRILQNSCLKPGENVLFRSAEGDGEKFLFLAAVDCEDAMAGDVLYRLFKVVIHLVDAAALLELFICLSLGRDRRRTSALCSFSGGSGSLPGTACRLLRRLFLRPDRSFFHGRAADIGAKVRLVRDLLGDDVGGAGKSLLRRVHAEVLRDRGIGTGYISGSFCFQRGSCILCEYIFRERCKALFPGNAGSRLPLRPIRAVEVVDSNLRFGIFYLRSEFIREFSLFLNRRKDLCLLLFERAKISELFGEGAQLLVVQRARCLLAVAGDEGNRISLIDEFHGRLDLSAADLKRIGDFLNNIHFYAILPAFVVPCKEPTLFYFTPRSAYPKSAGFRIADQFGTNLGQMREIVRHKNADQR